MSETKQSPLTQDGWANALTGLGMLNRDKRKSTQFIRDGQQRSQTELENLYAGDDIASRIVDALPDEMTREWITFKCDDPAVASAVSQALVDLGVQSKLRQTLIWARLFGGAAMLIGADDGQAVDQPLSMDKTKSLTFLTPLDRYALYADLPYADPLSPKYGQPEWYALQAQLGSGHGENTHFGVKVHETRFLRFDGVLTTPRRQQQNQTWGDSVLERVAELLPDFGTIYAGTAHMVQDFSQGVYKLKNLQAIIAAGNEADVVKRMQLIDMSRSLVRAIILDADGEEFTRTSASFAGLPDIMDRWTVRLAAAARMPVAILMGQSPAGMNATGDMEMRYWYDHVKTQQEAVLRPAITKLLTIMLNADSGPTQGVEPEQWSFTFNPLWQLNDLEQADVRLKQAQTDQIYIQNGVLDAAEVSKSRFGGDEYSTETTLDADMRESFAAPTAPADDEVAPASLSS